MNSKIALPLALVLSVLVFVSPPCTAEDKPIIISGSTSYTPFYFRDAHGHVSGLFVDFWEAWAKKVDREIRFETRPFAQVLDDVEQGSVDLVAGFFYSAERERRFDYSQPFYEIQTHIFFHKQVYGLKELSDLTGFAIGIVKGTYAQEYILSHLPKASLATYDHFEDLVKAAILGEIQVFVCATPVTLFLLAKYNHTNEFKHTAQPLYTSKIFAGVQKGNQALLDLVNLGIGRISPNERADIDRSWQGIGASYVFPWAMVGMVLITVVLCVTGLMLWNHQLQRRVTKATCELELQRAQLEASERSLQKGNEDLEKRVHQRTLQLQSSNQLLEEQIRTRTRSQRRLSQNNAYLSALHETMLGLMRRLDLQELLEAIMKRVTNATGSQHGYVYLQDDTSQELVLRVGSGVFASSIGYSIQSGEGLAGKVLERGRYLVVEDYHTWEGRHPGSRWDGLGAVIGIPLTSGGHTVGVIGLCFMQSEGAFSEDEISFLNGLAELASIALDNARLYENLQNELAERERNETERKRLEERVQQAQKMEAIGTLAGGIAHDFNNILAVIMGNIELALEDIPQPSALYNYLNDGFQSTIRARDLVQQILTFSRKGTLETLPIHVASVVAQGIKLIRASIPTSIDIRQRLITGDAHINASIVQIHQVLMNLSANAAHAMEESGGVLDIHLRKAVLDNEICQQHPDVCPGNYIQLTITDSGHGIPSEMMSRIFDPYFSTKAIERGTGLGLAVVHGIVRSYQGLILAHSTPDQGTQFDIYLPECDGTQPNAPEKAATHGSGSESILLVDDEAELLSLVGTALERKGYRVTTCTDGSQALEQFNQSPEDFDIVITDMTMPRLNGDKLAEAILTRQPSTPVVMCTGFSHVISQEKAQQIGIRKLLMKPVFMEDLLVAIRDVLDHPN